MSSTSGNVQPFFVNYEFEYQMLQAEDTLRLTKMALVNTIDLTGKYIEPDYFLWKSAKEWLRTLGDITECDLIVYYVPMRIMRLITRRAPMLAGDRSRGAISPASILSESRNYPNCVYWRIFYFMWLRRIHEFFCVHSNPIWKGRNCRDFCPSHLTFREYFRPFWFSRSCVVTRGSISPGTDT